MDKNSLSMIGLCRKAGKLLIGSDKAEELIKSGRARLVISASNTSGNTLKKLKRLTEGTDLLITIPFGKADLARASGTERDVAVVSTADGNFAAAIRQKLKDSTYLEDDANGYRK